LEDLEEEIENRLAELRRSYRGEIVLRSQVHHLFREEK
jgi:hypothetical protein